MATNRRFMTREEAVERIFNDYDSHDEDFDDIETSDVDESVADSQSQPQHMEVSDDEPSDDDDDGTGDQSEPIADPAQPHDAPPPVHVAEDDNDGNAIDNNAGNNDAINAADDDDAYNAETDNDDDDDDDNGAPAPRHWIPRPPAAAQQAPQQQAPPRVQRQRINVDEAYKDPAWLRNFAQVVGPRLHDQESSPWEIFQDLLPPQAIQLLVRETNRYADQFFQARGNNLPPFSRARRWKPVDESDMKAFIGLTLFMGMVKLPTYDLYWANNWMLNMGMKGVMSRDRYLGILSFLHCADNEAMPDRESPNYDRLYKVRDIMEVCVGSWQAAYGPAREISIDETVIAFKGTTGLKNYNPAKPHKWGLTVWSLAEARTGYVHTWEVYLGKTARPDPRTQNNDYRGSVHWVVWDALVKAGILNKGHHLYMDNYFSSATLFNDLARANTGACGTLRRNRYGTPDIIKQAKPKKSDPPVITHAGQFDTLFLSWMDRNLVNLISTIHTDDMFKKQTRSKTDPTGWQERDKPLAVEAYTTYMRGVDLADQAMWYSLLTHRTMKWWKKILFGLLEVAFTNTLVIYRKLNPGSKVDRNKVRLSIINELTLGYRHGRLVAEYGPQIELRLQFGPGMHFPEFLTKKTANGLLHYPDCVVCSKRNVRGQPKTRHQVTTQCNTCKVPLCAVPCMMRFHTMPGMTYKITCFKGLHSAQYHADL